MDKTFKPCTVYNYFPSLFQIICDRKHRYVYLVDEDKTEFEAIFEFFKDCKGITRGLTEDGILNCYISIDNKNRKMIVDLLGEYSRENGVNQIHKTRKNIMDLWEKDSRENGVKDRKILMNLLEKYSKENAGSKLELDHTFPVYFDDNDDDPDYGHIIRRDERRYKKYMSLINK